MKKIISFILALVMTVALFGCSAKTEVPAAPVAEAPADNSADSLADFEPQKITVFHNSAEANPEPKALAWFAEELEKRTNGKLTCELYFDGLLGSENETMEQMEEGTVHVTFFGWGADGKYCPEYNVYAVPYLFDSRELVESIGATWVGQAITDALAEHNIKAFGYVYKGNRQLTCNRYVQTPEDLKGLKLRIGDNAVYAKVFTALGCMPTVIAASESYMCLQTGVTDAQENAVITNNNRAFYEVQDYTILTNHFVDFSRFCVNKAWFDALPQELQDIVYQLGLETCEKGTKYMEDNEEKAIQNQKDHGMEFVAVDSMPFKEAAMSVLPDIAVDWADGVYEEVCNVTGLSPIA